MAYRVQERCRKVRIRKHNAYSYSGDSMRIPSDADQRSELMAIAIPS